MTRPHFFRACLIGLCLFLFVPVNAQPVDTLALRARADSLDRMANDFIQNGDLEAAAENYLEAAQIRERVLGKQHPDYATSLNNIGICHWYSGDFDQAFSCFSNAMEILRSVSGERSLQYANLLNSLGNCYAGIGEYRKAIEQYTEAIGILDEVSDEGHPAYARSLMNIGNCYGELGENDKSLEFYEKALEIRRRTVGEHHPDYAVNLNNLGTYYASLGDFEKAIGYFSKALEIQSDFFGEVHPDNASRLNNLGLCYWSLGDYERATDCLARSTEIYKEVFGEQHLAYVMGLINLGGCYSEHGEYDKAIDCLKKGVEIHRDVYGGQHPNYAGCLNNLGLCYWSLGDLDNAADCLNQAKDHYRDVFGERHQDYVMSLINLGLVHAAKGEEDAASACIREFISISSGLVLDAFTYLPQGPRSIYWDTYSSYFTNTIPIYTKKYAEDSEFLCTAYNAALFSKGLLLNTETEMRRLILESGDQEALSLYDQLQEERQQLDELYELPVAERMFPIDSLETVVESLERNLQQKSKAFGDYTKNLSVGWKDVQSSLGKRGIALEFLEIPVSEDTTVYCALTLKAGYDAPHYVELFDLTELDALKAKYDGLRNSEGLIYGDKALYDLVWKPLEKELKGVKNIYFGPSGDLYQTAIEYADNGKGPLARQKNIFRLSSTRQLAVPHGETERRRSAVFGGLKYGASEEVLLADSRKYAQRSMPEDLFFSVDSLNIRGAGGSVMVADLPGTESEAREIDALLRKEGLDNTLRMGEEGTEAAFKDLSGRHENIIHVATHGFYWNGQQAQEDAAMTRSGLLFSGANNALKKSYVRQEGVEDGILTAQEIARLDLRGADLLVLSACQTGLGEVSGEGVFGLQRGFKKAGVNTILMSLWEVDDEATQLLMTQFYKGLTKGLSKTDALKAAQAAVRTNKNRDFSSPYYWAAFILLDGKE